MSDFDKPITALTPQRHRRAVAQLVNEERRKRGLSPLRYTASLRLSARTWSVVMVRDSRFSHGSWAKRVLRFPFVLAGSPRGRDVGENLAWATGGFTTPREIVKDWMSSPGHRANILRPKWQYGAVWSSPDTPLPGRQSDGVTVVHHFGGRR
jgi:uncharacterized protein YkwD